MAERVGVLNREFAIPNVYSGFQLISRAGNDLASSNLRRRLPPFAGYCRFFHFNGTRNGTRPRTLSRLSPAVAPEVINLVIPNFSLTGYIQVIY